MQFSEIKFNSSLLHKYGVVKIDNEKVCFVCNRRTNFLDIYAEVPICSTECQEHLQCIVNAAEDSGVLL